MKTLLQINASMFAGNGQSSQLANQFVTAWKLRNPGGRVIVRELAEDPVPHLDGARFSAFLAAPEARTPEQRAIVAYSDALVEEIKAADTIVIGLPLYNFGVPSQLKAYFDHIARAGVTFKYTDKGPVGLIADKPVVVFAARGGRYAGTPMDTQTGFVRDFLRFIGLANVEFVYAEGLAMGDESKTAALSAARDRLERLAA